MRHKIEINWEQIKALCAIMCTRDEIANVFNCTGKTINNRCVKEQHTTFERFWDKYSATGKVSIRRHLFKESEGGNVGASCFLAKNYLGMKDEQNINQNIKIDAASELSDAELEIIARGKQGKRGLGTIASPPVTPTVN